MRVAILSDIHDQVWNLEAALAVLFHCDAMICLGDLCSPFIVDQIGRGFHRPIHIVFGNNDGDRHRITAKAAKYEHIRIRGEFFEDEFGGRKVAAQHFDNMGMALGRSGLYDAVFFGHDHQPGMETSGKTLIINPGSIMGCQFDADGKRTEVIPGYALWETEPNTAMFYSIHPQGPRNQGFGFA